MKQNPSALNPNVEFQVAASQERFAELERALARDEGPNAGERERGAYCVITRSTGVERVTYLVREVVMPEDGQVWFGPDGLQFDDDYRHEATERAVSQDAGLLIIHTHPAGPAGPSGGDYAPDANDLYTGAQRLKPNVPLAAGVYSEDESWHVRACEMSVARTPNQHGQANFGPESASWRAATAIRVVGGERFKKIETTEPATGPAGATGPVDEEFVDSSQRIWGRTGQQKLAGLRVGVVGCGGGGSLLTEFLPRLGVGEIVLVDFDWLEPANANRALGATREDIEERRLKVRVGARVANRSAVAENFQVRPVVGSIVESVREDYEVLQHLLDCDIIMNAADPHWARKVLDDVAYSHLIPIIDGGTLLETDEHGTLTDNAQSNIALAGPSQPCLQCADMWNENQVNEDKEGDVPNGYMEDTQLRAPSVISFNALVESFATQRLQAYALGVAPEATTGALRYLPATADLRWRQHGLDSRRTRCDKDCARPAKEAFGDNINDELDRRVDPKLSEKIDEGLGASGVVEPAPATSTETKTKDSETKGLLQKLWGLLRAIREFLTF